ncbi:MAG: hypothetical protein ACQEQG_02580 [Bacillota bacterium]
MKRVKQGVIGLLFCLGLVFIGISPGIFAVEYPGEELIIAPVPVESLDPHITWEQGRNHLHSLLYDSLYEYDSEKDELVPDLAAEPVSARACGSEGGLIEYTFTIDSEKLFNSGRPVTPEDVKYSIFREMLIDAPGGGAGYYWQALFNVPDLASFIERITGYSDPEQLSYQNARKVFRRMETQIYTVGEKLVILAQAIDDFSFLFSDLVPWSAVVDKEYLVSQGSWNGEAGTWPLFYRRQAKSSPASFNNRAGSRDWQVALWSPDDFLLLAKSEESEKWYDDTESLKVIFTPARLDKLAGPLKAGLPDLVRLLPEHDLNLDESKLTEMYEKRIISAESRIYLIRSKSKFAQSSLEDTVVYYQHNEQHRQLAEALVESSEFEGGGLEPLCWPEYYDRITHGDFNLAVVEVLDPFGGRLGFYNPFSRFSQYPLEVVELLAEPRRIEYQKK